ncbi:hypothetical protein [Pedobacter steynii]
MLDEHSGKLKMVYAALSMAVCMEIDGNSIWIGTNSGLFRYNMLHNSAEQMFAAGGVSLTGTISALKLDPSKNLWIGSGSGRIYLYNNSSSQIEFLKTADHKDGLDGG